jgi:hypothetical protein
LEAKKLNLSIRYLVPFYPVKGYNVKLHQLFLERPEEKGDLNMRNEKTFDISIHTILLYYKKSSFKFLHNLIRSNK